MPRGARGGSRRETEYSSTGSTGVFDRKEIVVGKIVGAGTYCNVYQVKAIHLLEANDDMCVQWTRDCLAQNATRRKSGEARYYIKFLKQHYLMDNSGFEKAASTLHNEIEILRSLRHVSPIRAVAKQGCEAYYCNGTHDSYFWIMDRMVETLEEFEDHVCRNYLDHLDRGSKPQDMYRARSSIALLV